MKKINTILMLSLALFGATACSDDNNAEEATTAETVDLSEAVSGTYDGYTLASCSYFSNSLSVNQTVSITANVDHTVTVSYTSATWGTFTIENATVSGSEAQYTINGTGSSLMGHAGATAKEYECTLSGSVINGVAELTFSCPTVMNGLTILFVQGDVPAELVVPGTYNGYTTASSLYFKDTVSENQDVTVVKNDDNTYTVSYTSSTWGTFTYNNVQVTYADGKYTLAGEGSTLMGMNGSVKEYDSSLTGEIDVEKTAPTFLFSIPTVMGGMTIQFHLGEYKG